MTNFAKSILLLLILTCASFAQDSPSSATPAQTCAESVSRACRSAVDELGIARKLVQTLQTELAALETRLAAEKDRAAKMAAANQAQHEQTEQLQAALAAEREAKTELDKLHATDHARIIKLEAERTKLEAERAKVRGRQKIFIIALAALPVGAIVGR